MAAGLYWANGNNLFATIEPMEGIYVWRWMIDDPQTVMAYFFRLMFCTICGEREHDVVIAKTDDGTEYRISELRNIFFNCGIIVSKSK